MISNHIVLSKVKKAPEVEKSGCRNNLSLIGRIYPVSTSWRRANRRKIRLRRMIRL